MLLLRANETVSADRLIEQLWGDAVPADATNALQVHVSRLRRALGAGALITTAAGYHLRVEPGALDAETFEAGAEDGRRALAAGRPLEAADALRQALGLWRGSAVADCAYDAFAQADIARLEELRLAAARGAHGRGAGAGAVPRAPSSSGWSESTRCASGCAAS